MTNQPNSEQRAEERQLKTATILICSKCAKRNGFDYGDRIGGTFTPDRCQYCNEEDHLGEYVVAIRLTEQEHTT